MCAKLSAEGVTLVGSERLLTSQSDPLGRLIKDLTIAQDIARLAITVDAKIVLNHRGHKLSACMKE